VSDSRTVRALLVAAADRPARSPAPYFVDGVETIERFLRERAFAAHHLDVRVKGTVKPSVSRSQFKSALAGLVDTAQPDDLAVIMFGGHGDDGELLHPQEGWVFPDGVFTDTDLAKALVRFRPGVEKVVVSDCCYGGGMFTPETVTMRAFLRRRVRRLASAIALASPHKAADFVIIASALPDQTVAIGTIDDFAVAIRTQSPTCADYEELGERFRAASELLFSQWMVDGRPDASMQQPPFATSI
jgi:hypothetical protein